MVGGSPGVDQPGAARHWDETMRGHEAARQAAGERLRTAAALLLEAIADDAPGEAALVAEIAGLLGNVTSPALSSGESPWPGEPLTESETRVLRYLPTHMGAPDIAAELCLSANTVRTHLRHLYRKLGVHSRREAVQRARAIGLLAGSAPRS
jgi:LuxR family maltose regulon positive regulatory protein